jgi:uncharacterized protein (DUF2235 family)
MKRIVICCDGTWNLPDKDSAGIPVPTNVVKLSEAVCHRDKNGIEQVLYYDPGIGTSGGLLKRVYDGFSGAGLSRNILEAYRYLIAKYEAGDELFLFGFSRGAFTVRSLAGLVRSCGILRPDTTDMVERAFEFYRSRAPGTHPREKEASLFRRTFAISDIVPIKFIGVWDTVGALGNPLLSNQLSKRNKFHDTDLSSTIEHAYQALAIDEKRRAFQATLWHQQPPEKRLLAAPQTLEQVWFAGVHSNIGGGCPTTGLSDIALDWIADKAAVCGLELDFSEIAVQPDPLQARAESRTGFTRLIPALYRPIAKPVDEQRPTNESLHLSVIERYQKDASYRPKNLEDYLNRYFNNYPNLRPPVQAPPQTEKDDSNGKDKTRPPRYI